MQNSCVVDRCPCYFGRVFPHVDTREPEEVLGACRAVWKMITGREEDGLLTRAFAWLQAAFEGRHPDYEPLDTQYHDLEHTLQGTLCLARLLERWHRIGARPTLDEISIRLGMLGILLHDTGYLKPRGDHEGTGAKFTPIHVQRSAEVAARFLGAEGFRRQEIHEAQCMIRCTGVNADVRSIAFERTLSRKVGCALASADLLGQMAADDYIDKLPALQREFAEAAATNTGPDAASLKHFRIPEELIRETPAFWKFYVLPRLEQDFEGVYRLLNDPWPSGPNEYVRRVESNLSRIRDPSVVTPA